MAGNGRGRLVVCPTPIGNLEDVTLRALRVLREADLVLAEVGRQLGYGLVGVVNVFNPEVIVIGGGAARGGDLLLTPARRVIEERALPPARDGLRILPAHYGDEAGMIGAALMALESLG